MNFLRSQQQDPASSRRSSSTLLRGYITRKAGTVHLGLARVFGVLLLFLFTGCKSAPGPASPFPQIKIAEAPSEQAPAAAYPPDPLNPASVSKGPLQALPLGEITSPALAPLGAIFVEWDADPSLGVVSNLYGSSDGQSWALLLSSTNCQAVFDRSTPFQFFTVSSSNSVGEAFAGSTNVIWKH